MDALYRLEADKLDIFLQSLGPDIYAPVKTDAIRFQKISSVKEADLTALADVPVKDFFFRQREQLFKFTKGKIATEIKDAPFRIFFGLRRCDLNAVKHQDFIFIEKYKDPYYTAQRKNTLLFGYHCDEALNKYCFCGSMGLEEYHDIMFFDKKKYFLLNPGSKVGQKIVSEAKLKRAGTLKKKDTIPKGTDRLEKKDISKLFENSLWEKGADECLSCSACTSLCPTCYCHEVKDDVKLSDLKSGERTREWSSCQLKSFTRVAGEHVFREKRVDRFKHRIYHQLVYFKERYGVNMCVGCGRCITHCPTTIDFVSLINKMK
ncbi:MAG: hypothetical protein HGA85_00035 [Nanoarchaeota archaeon]|nr:hypothetical protein [Nanoarchaeota archaeon]